MALILVLASACGGGESSPEDPDGGPPIGATICEAGDRAFVVRATLAILGRRPLDQDEARPLVELMEETRRTPHAPHEPGIDPRVAVAERLFAKPELVERWSELLQDHLRVQRINDQSQVGCYGFQERGEDRGELAAYVRDNAAGSEGDGRGGFTMRDLLRSSIRLDDLTPALRGHLFAMLSRPIPAANVPRVQAELARRDDFGNMFDAAYLRRDLVCLGCHNSEGSVTFDPDPALNRHWPLPGLLERALYGQSNGIDPASAHAVFRFDGFVDDPFFGGGGGERPWGWSAECGRFHPFMLEPDPAGVDGKFGNITGDRSTIYDLEASLMRGVDALAESGLVMDIEGNIADPDAAFAYLVGASLVEFVWTEVIGSPLTIANYFARNEASRDVLHGLTTRFVASRFSLRELLVDIVTSEWFNPALPSAGCGAAPYALDNVYNPWVISEGDEAMRRNSAGDAVHPLSARTLLSAAYAALGWTSPSYTAFPEVPDEVYFCLSGGFTCSQIEAYCAATGDCCIAVEYCNDRSLLDAPQEEQAFQRGVGTFLKNGERGFRGLDFQARLVWEERFGSCENPTDDPDFIDDLVSRAAAGGLTVHDVVLSLKDRLVSDPHVDTTPGDNGLSEASALEALFATPLSTDASSVTTLERPLRRLCGVLLSSPQFLLAP